MPSRPSRSKRRAERGSARSSRSARTGAASKALPPATVALSRALREARVSAKLNQTDAAKRIGVHFVTIYAWENEKRGDQPSDANLARAAKVYRTTPEALKRRAAALERTLDGHESGSSAGARNGSTADRAANGAHDAGATAPPNAVVADAHGAVAVGSRRAAGKRAARGTGRHVPSKRSGAMAGASADRAIVSKVLRVLADVADKVPLTPETLNAAQRALLAPALIDVFAAFKSGPMSDEDINAAYDATGAAVVGFVQRRVPSA
jgi:transcriptional regulator with XRE-family HTH domain